MGGVCVDPNAMLNQAEKLQHLSNEFMDLSLAIDSGKPGNLPFVGDAEARLSTAMVHGATGAVEQYEIAGTLAVKGVEMITADGRSMNAEQLLIAAFVAMGGTRLFESVKGKILEPIAPMLSAYGQYTSIRGVMDKISANPPKHLSGLIKTLGIKGTVWSEFAGVGLSGGTMLAIDRYVTDSDVKLNMLDEYEQMNSDGDFGIAMSIGMKIHQFFDATPPPPTRSRSGLELIDDGGEGSWLATY